VALPGIVTALLGFFIIHVLSVRRQRRDEQFKMVQATQALIIAAATEAEEAWQVRRGREAIGPLLIQRVARIGRAIQQLRKRDPKLDVDACMTAFRQAVTLDYESGSPSPSRRAEIAITAAALEERVMSCFLKRFG